MKHMMRSVVVWATIVPAIFASSAAWAQKPGGTLRIYHRDSPAHMSIYEEGTLSIVAPMMGVFNNLVVFDPNQAQNRLDDIIPDLAESWSWNAAGTELTFKLRQGSNGTTASRSPRPTSNAPGICCRARCRTNCGSMRARPGGSTSTR
jgi:ABC-type transport system substrate-binding protein